MIPNVSKTTWILAAVLILSGSQGFAKDAKENPYKASKVGQWVQHKTVSLAMGNKSTILSKQTVTAKDEASITLNMETEMGKNKFPARSVVLKFADMKKQEEDNKKKPGYKMETLAEGDETITVGGTSYACHWTQTKITMTTPMVSVTTAKSWTSKKVPLTQIVKMESSTVMTVGGKEMTTTSSMELVGSGG